MTKLLALVAISAVILAAVLGYGAVKADARADAARAAWEATDSTFRAYRDSVKGVRVARDDSIRSAQEAADSVRLRADSIAAARDTLVIERLIPTLPDSVQEAIAELRASYETELAERRAESDSLRAVILLAGRQRRDLETELTKVNARLADALRGWDAAERARRPGLVGRFTQGLAVIGLAVVADRATCGLTGSGLLLPCGR